MSAIEVEDYCDFIADRPIEPNDKVNAFIEVNKTKVQGNMAEIGSTILFQFLILFFFVEKNDSELNTSNQSINLHLSIVSSHAASIRLSDEHIASVSDNDLGDSPKSTCSQFTTMSEIEQADKTLSQENDQDALKPKATVKRRSSNRLTKSQLEILNFECSPNSTPGPVTRSKRKAQTQKPVSEENNYDYIIKTTRTRATRSVTSSPPSPVKSVASSASTTVARNSLKRKGSNRIKKPTIISPPTPRAEDHLESLDEEKPQEDTDDSKRYNLRTRIRTPQKYDEGDYELATVSKKIRRATTKKTASLYKIDETPDNAQHSQQAFPFSNPNNFNFSSQTSESGSVAMSIGNSEDDANSSFTFSPPQSTTKKK